MSEQRKYHRKGKTLNVTLSVGNTRKDIITMSNTPYQSNAYLFTIHNNNGVFFLFKICIIYKSQLNTFFSVILILIVNYKQLWRSIITVSRYIRTVLYREKKQWEKKTKRKNCKRSTIKRNVKNFHVQSGSILLIKLPFIWIFCACKGIDSGWYWYKSPS